MNFNKIQDLDDAPVTGLKRLGNLTVVQVHDLPFIFGLIAFIYRLEHPSFIIHPKLQHFEELVSILKGRVNKFFGKSPFMT